MNKPRLIEIFVAFSLFGFVSGAVVNTVGCKELTPAVKQEIIEKKDAACALANAGLSDDRIKAICALTDTILGPIMDLVSVHRAAIAQSRAVGVTEGMAKAGACTPQPILNPVQRDAGASIADAGRDAK